MRLDHTNGDLVAKIAELQHTFFEHMFSITFLAKYGKYSVKKIILTEPFGGKISGFIDLNCCYVKVLSFFTVPIFPTVLSLFGLVAQIHVPPVH